MGAQETERTVSPHRRQAERRRRRQEAECERRRRAGDRMRSKDASRVHRGTNEIPVDKECFRS